MGRGWGGRVAVRLRVLVLAVKGDTCHLCGLEGADSADHDPPRSVLIGSVPDPDHIDYLFPAHLVPCNTSRQDRENTPSLRAELRTKRRAYLSRQSVDLSPRFERRRSVFPSTPTPGKPPPLTSPPEVPQKKGIRNRKAPNNAG